MARYEILDTFPAFERFWRSARSRPIPEQIDRWKREYLGPWPDLWRKQFRSYRADGQDWRSVAHNRVFPTLDQRLPRMRKVHSLLLRGIPIASRRIRSHLGEDFSVLFVIHVGIGVGAGWATTFRGAPAVLFGLENAAELGWSDPYTLVALVEHELAHLVHDHWRRERRVGALERHRGPWWQLYQEGFATRCEIRMGEIGAHHSVSPNQDWLQWCEENRSRLASLFLRSTSSAVSMRRFFGSWYDVDGHIETGYYLGAEVVRDWESKCSLREIACWGPGPARERCRAALRRMAASLP